MKKIKEERGSITLFVLISMLFFLLLLTSAYMLSTNKEITGIAETSKIKEIYEQGINEIDDVYETLINKDLPVADGSYSKIKGVNTPNLVKGMTAVIYDETTGITSTSKTNNKWYEYKEQTNTTENGGDSRWANAQTSDGSLWVWIPRYSYRINGEHSNVTETIDVKFSEGITDYTKEGYKVHPAFEFGTEKLPGIWVAKFEMSAETDNIESQPGNVPTTDSIKMVSKPERSSWRAIAVNNIFTNCLEYNKKLNSHMMKNTEWGCVAYLAHSKYGRNGTEVTINNNNRYMTGYGADSVSAGEVDNTNISQNKWTGEYGKLASTTGNVYGIYDMAGGAWEYVAGNLEVNTNGTGGTVGSAGSNTTFTDVFKIGNKYFDFYKYSGIPGESGRESNYQANSEKKGDAIYETSTAETGSTGWHSDYSHFVYSDSPWFLRGRLLQSWLDCRFFLFRHQYRRGAQQLQFPCSMCTLVLQQNNNKYSDKRKLKVSKK